jgi:hypothetical protein
MQEWQELIIKNSIIDSYINFLSQGEAILNMPLQYDRSEY